MNQQERIARIQQNQAEVRRFVAEQHKHSQAARFESWQLVFIGMVAGAVLFGAGAAFMKLFS